MSKIRASEVWKEIKPFAIQDLIKLEKKSGGAEGCLWRQDINNLSSHALPVLEGDHNTVFGEEAGLSTSFGDNNVFMGSEAGWYNASGTSNVFIGRSAGYWNMDGEFNVFIGYNAGFNNDNTESGIANYNVFIGSDAGSTNKDGSDNVFIGSEAGYDNVSGNYNTSVGRYSGKMCNASENVYIGYSAGYYNVNGVNNTYAGVYCGWASSSGSDNAFFGYYAGRLTTGSYNVFMGAFAGYSNVTGAGNVSLGYKAGYSETGSNKLYISNSDTVDPLIYGEFDNGIVKINGSLQITGSVSGSGGGGGIIDTAEVTYTPTVLADWDSDADPGDLDDALNQLAERVDDNEIAIASLSGMVIKKSQTVAFGDFTDNLDATGQIDLTDTIPVGAHVLVVLCTALTGFAGDVSATVQIGDGTDPDRYNTGTPDVFSDAANGISLGDPSGVKYHTAISTVRVTVTVDSDFTSVSAGSMALEIYYLT